LLSKAKSLIQLIRRRSVPVSAKDSNHTRSPIVPHSVSHEAVLDATFKPESWDGIELDYLEVSIPEEGANLDFEIEVSAEDYFIAHRGDKARGTFERVDVIRWDHDEVDWALEEFDFEPPANSAKPRSAAQPPRLAESQYPALQYEDALKRLREFALQRGWLAAAAALEKASQQFPTLSARERAAIEHVLDAAGTLNRHRSDAEALRNILFNERGDDAERLEPTAQTSKGAAAGVGRQKLLTRKDNAEAKTLTQKAISSSVLRVRNMAAERNWLSPKSSLALAKLAHRKTALTRSEMNALTYLLNRCANIPELKADVGIVRKATTM
jgi:hypothetical protein